MHRLIARLGPILVVGLVLAFGPAIAATAHPTTTVASSTLARQTEPVTIVAEDSPSRATPRGEQTLRLAGPVAGLGALDPALVRDLDTAFLARQVFRGLMTLNGDLEPVPALAEQVEISADGLDYRFTLRANAAFQDGRPIGADDVVFSLTRALDPATAGGWREALGGPTYLADIDGAEELLAGKTDRLRGVEALDERTVAVRLVAPRATFLMKLSGISAAVVDRRTVGDGEWWRTPNGSGPFRVAEWIVNESLILARFDGFYAGPPPLARIEFRLGAQAAQPFNLYQAGEIDLTRLPDDAVDRALDPAGGVAADVTVAPMFAVGYIAFNPTVAPMDDAQIRRAVRLAFPAEKIAAVARNGHVLRAAGMVPHGMLGRQWPVASPDADIAAARRAIAASRYGTAARVPPVRIYGGSPTGAEALRDVLGEELGLRVEVVAVDWGQFLDGLTRDEYPAYELYWGADYPDPESFLQSLFGSTSSDNYIDYTNPEMDRLLATAAELFDPAERAVLYAEAQALLLADDVVIPLYYDVRYVAVSSAVHGLILSPLGIVGLDGVWMEH